MSLLTNLISYWKLDEASGNALDAHGSNNLTENGTGGVGSATGILNGARDFESGDVDYFEIADNTDLSTGDIDCSGGLWINLESSGTFQVLMSKWGSSGNREYRLAYDQNTNRFTISVVVGTSQTNLKADNFGTANGTGVWRFVGWYHDSVNNVLGIGVNDVWNTASYSAGMSDSTAPFRIGRENGFGELDGLADEGFFYKRVLTGAEWTTLYGSGTPPGYDSFGGGSVTTSAAGAAAALTIARAVGASAKAAPGRSNPLTAARGTGASTRAGIGRVVDLTDARAPGAILIPVPGRSNPLTVARSVAAITEAAPGRTVDLTAARTPGAKLLAIPGLSNPLSIVGGSGADVRAGTGRTVAIDRATAPGASLIGMPGRITDLTIPRASGATTAAGTGANVALTAARATAAKLASAPGRLACLTIVRGVTSNGANIEARAGVSCTLTIVHAIRAEPPYEWTRTPSGGTTVRARAAFKLEAFDCEDLEIYGTVATLTTLTGAALQWIGWDEDGNVAWDSAASPATATAEVVDGAARTYVATTPPKAAGVYRWQLRITNTGQNTVPVWGYLTITESAAEIPTATIEKLTGES